MEVETFNNGRLGLHAAVWLHMSVRERGLGLLRPRLHTSPVSVMTVPLKAAYAHM